MGKTVTAAVLGLLAGILITGTFLIGWEKLPQTGQSDSGGARLPSSFESASRRLPHPSSERISTLSEALSRTSVFARNAAVHELAQGASSEDLQNYIFDANQLEETAARRQVLEVLFTALAEVDPRTAIEVARLDQFRATRDLERVVWTTWALNDLDEALFAVKIETDQYYATLAQDSVLAAYGIDGNPVARRIRSELGVEMSPQYLQSYVELLLERDPRSAIGYLNSIGYQQDHYPAYYLVGEKLALSDPDNAFALAASIDAKEPRRMIEHMLRERIIAENPVGVIEDYLAGNSAKRNELRSAFSALATKDLDSALAYYRKLDDQVLKSALANTIGHAMAEKDPYEALAFVREERVTSHLGFSAEENIIGHIAKLDPEAALAAADESANLTSRPMMYQEIVHTVARTDIDKAIGLLDKIEEPKFRRQATQTIANVWINEDPMAAMQWMRAEALKMGQENLVATTLRSVSMSDAGTIRDLLPALEPHEKVDVVRGLLSNPFAASMPEAMELIAELDGQEGHEQLMAQLVANVSQFDTRRAKQIADEIDDPDARSSAYTSLVTTAAQASPQDAIAMLPSIDAGPHRETAVAQIASVWAQSDADATTAWVLSLPAGTARTRATHNLLPHVAAIQAKHLELINDIPGEEDRINAVMMAAFGADPTASDTWMNQVNLPAATIDDIRRQIEEIQRSAY